MPIKRAASSHAAAGSSNLGVQRAAIKAAARQRSATAANGAAAALGISRAANAVVRLRHRSRSPPHRNLEIDQTPFRTADRYPPSDDEARGLPGLRAAVVARGRQLMRCWGSSPVATSAPCFRMGTADFAAMSVRSAGAARAGDDILGSCSPAESASPNTADSDNDTIIADSRQPYVFRAAGSGQRDCCTFANRWAAAS